MQTVQTHPNCKTGCCADLNLYHGLLVQSMLPTSDSAGKTFLSGVRGWSADIGVFGVGIYTFSGLVGSELDESLGNILFWGKEALRGKRCLENEDL